MLYCLAATVVCTAAIDPPVLPMDVLIYSKQTVEGTELRARYPFGDRDMIMKGPFSPIVVSPDGRFLAFKHREALLTTGIFFLPRVVSTSPRRTEWQLVAPVTYNRSRRSWPGARTLADRFGGRPGYTANASALYYIKPERTSGEGSVMKATLNRNGWRMGEAVQMTNVGAPSTSGDFGLAVSPDGSSILIDAYLMLAGIPGKSLATIGPDGGAKARIPDADGGSVTFPAWSPDGSKAAFNWRRLLPSPSGIYTMNPDGSSLSLISGTSEDDLHVVWGRSGEIYFSRKEARFPTDEARDIYVWRGRGAPEKLLGEVGAVEHPVAVVRVTSIRRPE